MRSIRKNVASVVATLLEHFLLLDGTVIRTRTWNEDIPRNLQ